MEISDIWQKVYDILKSRSSNTIGFNVHMKDTVPVSVDDFNFTIAVPLEINKNMIYFRYKEDIENVLEQVTGKKLSLKILLDRELEMIEEDDEEYITPEKAIQELMEEDRRKRKESSLNSKFTFENFVVGPSNEYAFNAAHTAALNPGKNSLFIYGNSGLGKTHLMHAIGNRIYNFNPDAKIVYITSEEFTNEFITSLRENAVKSNSIELFRKKYREIDVLLIDDIQFIEAKEATQDEFFHTFNALQNANKQIVITSDRKPAELVNLSERLKTRFNGGFTIDISIPNYETRMAILQSKAIFHHVKIDDEVLSYIADKVKSSVRELEGILLKMISMSQMSRKPCDKELADFVINSFLPHDGIIKITPDKITDKVCMFYNVSKTDLMRKTKVKNIALPRQIAMYLCSNLTDMNNSMIGSYFGNRDRTTILSNVNKIGEMRKKDSKLDAEISQISNDLKNITL